ncbi:MAG: HEAT repeat domain-containing protein [Candidatus Rifleibacteriota bacterium]
MAEFNEIESFRYVKAVKKILEPASRFLEKLQQESCSDEVKLEALISLGKIGDNGSLNILIKAFENFPDYIEPITALGLYKNSTPVPKLLERLEDPDALYKDEIVRVLGEIGDPMATKPLIELLHDEDRMVRYYAARALYKMGGRDVVQSLCGLLNDPDEWIVINVLEILASLKDPEAIPSLVGQFEVARDSRLKAIIISSLSAFDEGKLLKTFESGLTSFDPRIQANSVEAISRLKIPALEMKRKLKKFYGHENNRVRANVCIALAQADREAIEKEIEAMLNSRDASTRRSAAYVLMNIDSENRVERIHQLLQDENFGVRKMALKAALALDENIGINEIIPLLEDKNQWVRRQAVECAVRVNDFPADRILELFENEDSSAVVESILKFINSRSLKTAVPMIFDRIKLEPEDELPWLIASLGHLGAREELKKVKRFLGAVRTEVFAQYYQALLINGDLTVFDEIVSFLTAKKRNQDLLVWSGITGEVGAFATDPDNYSRSLIAALEPEVKKDMQGVVTAFDEPDEEKNYERQLEQAMELHDSGNYSKAARLFKKIVDNQPENSDAAYYLASSYYNLGDVKKAIEQLNNNIRRFSDNFSSSLLLGQILFRKKEWQKLIDCYEKVTEKIAESDKRNKIRVFGALGLAYFHTKAYKKAINALKAALEINPRDLSSSYHLALCYYATGKNEQAKTILESLRKRLPSDSKVLKNVIELLQRI